MHIHSHISNRGPGLWLEEHKTLVFGDVHLGYEQELIKKGVLVPKVQRVQVEELLKDMLRGIRPDRIVINGDLKHEFGSISSQEWKDVTKILEWLRGRCKELAVLEGNHDPLLFPIARKLGIDLGEELRLGDILITHGDKVPKQLAPIIIAGHEHPAISIRDAAKVEKFKCFLKTKFKKSVLIVQPSVQPLLEGSDILQGKLLTPLINNIDKCEVFVVDGMDALYFGKVRDIRRKLGV